VAERPLGSIEMRLPTYQIDSRSEGSEGDQGGPDVGFCPGPRVTALYCGAICDVRMGFLECSDKTSPAKFN
jgi:hypothetical protein